MISMFSGLSDFGGEVGVFVGRQSVTLGLSGLRIVDSSVGGMVSMLAMWLISSVMFTIDSN